MGLFSRIKSIPSSVSNALKISTTAVKSVASSGSLIEVVDAILEIPNEAIVERVNELRTEFPNATPAQLQSIVTRRFRSLAANASGVSGATAAFPGIGTLAGLAVSSAQLVGFVAQAGYYLLTLAHIHGIPEHDKDRRRLLVLASLMGEQGAEIASSQFGFSTVAALKGYATDMQRQTVKRINRALAKQASKQATRKGVTATFGKIMPFGIGAVLGWVIGRSMAGAVIEGAEHALGPAPESFSYPVNVDVQVVPAAERSSDG